MLSAGPGSKCKPKLLKDIKNFLSEVTGKLQNSAKLREKEANCGITLSCGLMAVLLLAFVLLSMES